MSFTKTLPKHLFLCGFMGAGKTTIGKLLADDLGLSFFDLDKEIEKKACKSVRQVFQKAGEHEFRKRERQAIKDFFKKEDCVIALGGGALQDQELTDLIKKNGLLIFIESPISVIFHRITGDSNRPLLLNKKGHEKKPEILKKELQTLYEERLPFYRQAEIQIKSSSYASPRQLAEDLPRKIKEHVAEN